jgi:hypothetical protein
MALLTQTFHAAQTFYIDPTAVNNARVADISAIDLYFKFKPDLNLNITGQPNPSVTLFLADTTFGVPRITRDSGIFTGKVVTVFNDDIFTSSDATVPTTFRFDTPITVETGKEYSWIVTYDIDSQFELWTSVVGEQLTGSTQISPGPSNKFIGRYYDFNNVFVADSEDPGDLDEYISSWRAINDTSAKFTVYLARYAHDLVPIGANGSIDSNDIIRGSNTANVTANSSSVGFNINFGSYEFLTFDENKSTKSIFVGGQWAFQNTVYYPGGYENSGQYIAITTQSSNATITANSQYPNGSSFAWSDIFSSTNDRNSLILTNGTKYNLRFVSAILSNTVLVLDEPVTFSNSDAKMMITPVGLVNSFDKSSPFGVSESFIMLNTSTANSTVRFVNDDIEAVSVTAGGSGYNNSDVFYVKGFEYVANKVEGGYVAVGNITTNSTGGITAVYLSNLGCGFVNTAAIEAVIANSTSVGNTTSNTSAGSSATFSYTVGSTIKTEYGNNNFVECKVRNLDIGTFIPFSTIDVPSGTDFQLQLQTNYYKVSDGSTLSGEAFYVNDSAANDQLQITMFDFNHTEQLSKIPCVPSKSNEFNINYLDTTPNDKVSNSATNSSESLKIVSTLTTNSDFSIVRITRPVIQFAKYIINNDATNEHTDSGNAYAKHISKTVNFTRTAEDVRVYLTAYKPANTDIKVYARIIKNEDEDAFDDLNWTELELKDGTGVLSSTSDVNDYVELTYGFYDVPNDRTQLNGVVQVASGDATITGSNTDFSTDLSAGDLVYMYQPLFRENHLVVAVESVTNTTSFEMDTTTTNSSILAEGMNIEKITYPGQAFNNKQNDNIVRYYNTSTSKFDGYETIAVKIVLLSDSPHRIPRVDDYKVIGTSV